MQNHATYNDANDHDHSIHPLPSQPEQQLNIFLLQVRQLLLQELFFLDFHKSQVNPIQSKLQMHKKMQHKHSHVHVVDRVFG